MTTELVRSVVAACCPQREPTAVEPISAGGRRPTALVRFATNPPLVVRLAADADAARTEAALLEAVGDRTAVPVPMVVAVGVHEGTPYLVTEHRPGRDLHTVVTDCGPARQRDIARQFGRYLAELHDRFAFDGCGELTVDGDMLVAPDQGCREWLRDYGRAAINRLPSEFDPLRDRLLGAVEALSAGSPRLFPWDLRPGNALTHDGSITAVVDWERPLAAPPGVAVAKTEYLVADWYVDDPAPLRAAFRDGYTAVRPLPSVDPGHRVIAIADSAVDSRGDVTTCGYPEQSRERSVAFHRSALEAAVSD